MNVRKSSVMIMAADPAMLFFADPSVVMMASMADFSIGWGGGVGG